MKIEDLEIEDLFSEDRSRSYDIKREIVSAVLKQGCLPSIIKYNDAFMQFEKKYDPYVKINFAQKWFEEIEEKIKTIALSDDLLLTGALFEIGVLHKQNRKIATIAFDDKNYRRDNISLSYRTVFSSSNTIKLWFTEREVKDDKINFVDKEVEFSFDTFLIQKRFEMDKASQKTEILKNQDLKKLGASNGNV